MADRILECDLKCLALNLIRVHLSLSDSVERAIESGYREIDAAKASVDTTIDLEARRRLSPAYAVDKNTAHRADELLASGSGLFSRATVYVEYGDVSSIAVEGHSFEDLARRITVDRHVCQCLSISRL